jgi:hypothetical protein
MSWLKPGPVRGMALFTLLALTTCLAALTLIAVLVWLWP